MIFVCDQNKWDIYLLDSNIEHKIISIIRNEI